LQEVDSAVTVIKKMMNVAADCVFGIILDESMDSEIKITIIAAGF
jgi:cell division GTPase FtsZ